MTLRYIEDVPAGTPIHLGTKGGEYFFSPTGQKIYISRAPKPPRKPRRFIPRRGAFLRFIENQSANV